MRTFYLPQEEWTPPLTLEGQEAKHLVKVLRAAVGDRISLLDGEGREGVCTIAATSKHKVELTLDSVIEHARPACRTVCAIGWAKSIRRSWLLEKAVEFEAEGLCFWQADRSQGTVPEDVKDSWQGQLVAGAKQCRTPWLPKLSTAPGGVRDLVTMGSEFDRRFILWEGQSPSDVPSTIISPADVGAAGRTLFVVGPEGGFSEAEVDTLLKGGFQAVSLGKRILRWETAALLCLGLDWWHRQVRETGDTADGHIPATQTQEDTAPSEETPCR